ncbi:MAG: hypothetical protein SNH66_07595 [Rikenellaceae bacterium]
MAANAGKGPDAYLGTEFLDYYSQFPSHNTVCVNGISSYPIMRCNHAFKLIGCYPEPATKDGLNQPITYSDMLFIEPETQSDQSRLMGIVTTSQTSGYYVDIFRSKQREGGDIMHDYFYHNLGTNMSIQSASGMDLDLQPTTELSSASVMIGAYSFFFDTKSNKTNENIKVTYKMDMPTGDDVYMTLWQKGERDRVIFSTLSPVNTGLGKMRNMPYDVHQTPTRTFVARQSGEAWSRPFVTIFEPSTKSKEGTIEAVEYFSDKAKSEEFVGILVKHKDGREDYILSQSDVNAESVCKEATLVGKYAVLSTIDKENASVFIGNATYLKWGDIVISSPQPSNVLIEKKDGAWSVVDAPKESKITIKSKRL